MAYGFFIFKLLDVSLRRLFFAILRLPAMGIRNLYICFLASEALAIIYQDV
jgi:hypothetical protein